MNMVKAQAVEGKLALFGGPKSVTTAPGDLFTWPIITQEDEQAALEVLRRGAMSGIEVTQQFEKEFAAWQGTEFALAFNNGTAAVLAAMFGVGVGAGDEVICPAMTYWASALPAYQLNATPVFADIIGETLCIDHNDIEKRITKRTRAIVVVHYFGYPAEMDTIMKIARKHGLKVIEDVSHAQGGRYKGRKLGTIGDVGAMSVMSGKSLAVGEGGMIATIDRSIYERAIAWGHYERFNSTYVQSPELLAHAGLPMGCVKNRMHQVSSAVGRVQLKHYDERCAEIRKAMNHFWDLLEGVPGIRAHRVDEKTGSNMGGWYAAHGMYVPEELGGLSLTRFSEAVRAEGGTCTPGANLGLHQHPLFNTVDILKQGKPTRIANSTRDVREAVGTLPVTEGINHRTYFVPWFKKFHAEKIAEHAAAYRKAAENYRELLEGDKGDPATLGGWATSRR
jgi:perosamine synthetase